jgi:phosphodiesterase/alkaline phosphatase D-like protein
VRFTFVSCQDIGQSACNAYRRMIYEDEGRPRAEQLGFVLHLGDFIYEVCWYPEDKPDGRRYGRRIRELFRYPHGENLHDYHLRSRSRTTALPRRPPGLPLTVGYRNHRGTGTFPRLMPGAG